MNCFGNLWGKFLKFNFQGLRLAAELLTHILSVHTNYFSVKIALNIYFLWYSNFSVKFFLIYVYSIAT